MEKKLEDLSKLTTVILRVHGSEHKELYKVHKLFHIIKINLEQQAILEKVEINPKVRMYERKPSKELKNEIARAKDELKPIKDENIKLFEELREVTDGYSAPEDGCTTYDTTYDLLEDLENDILKKAN